MDKIFKLFIAYFLVCLLPVLAGNIQPKVDGKQEKIFEIKLGKTRMNVSSNGGRVISYTYKRQEILTPSAENENYGSTFWTAPQSKWGWPPYEVLDKAEYSTKKVGSQLIMTSRPDPKSGFQFEKKWNQIGNKTIGIEYIVRNISEKVKSVGPWEVTRVPSGGIVFFPQGQNSKVPESTLKISYHKDNVNWVMVSKTPIAKHQKLFSTAREGWVAYAVNGLLFIKQFPDIDPEHYSPDQGEVEIYVDKDKKYIELENHGAYQALQPGKAFSYGVKWYLVEIPKSLNIEMGSKQLLSLTRNILK